MVDANRILFGLEVVFSVLNMLKVWLFLDSHKSLVLLRSTVDLDADAFLDSVLLDNRASRLTLLRVEF